MNMQDIVDQAFGSSQLIVMLPVEQNVLVDSHDHMTIYAY